MVPAAGNGTAAASAAASAFAMPAAAAPVPPAHAAQAELEREFARVHRLHEERRANPILAGALTRLADWQAQRLALTYADLKADPRHADAVSFFQTDLYGGADYSQRDSDIARVVPIMVRMLPERVIATIAEAMELNALSAELDHALLARLPRADGHFSVAEYCKAYRRMGNRPARERQIRLIGNIGAALDVYVRKPLIRSALTMMRAPARMAGFGVLHDFLDRGFNAFRRMDGAEYFLATVVARETALMDAMFAGETAPFTDPLAPAPGSPAGANAAAADPVRPS